MSTEDKSQYKRKASPLQIHHVHIDVEAMSFEKLLDMVLTKFPGLIIKTFEDKSTMKLIGSTMTAALESIITKAVSSAVATAIEQNNVRDWKQYTKTDIRSKQRANYWKPETERVERTHAIKLGE